MDDDERSLPLLLSLGDLDLLGVLELDFTLFLPLGDFDLDFALLGDLDLDFSLGILSN